MRVLAIAAIAACFGASVQAASLVAKNGNDSVRLTQAACAPEVTKLLPKELHDELKAAHAMVGGKTYRACWLLRDGWVFLQYEDGDGGRIPALDFKVDPGV